MSKKNVPAIVSALGVLMTIISELLSLVRQDGGTEEDFYALGTPEGKNTLKQMASLIIKAGQMARNTFRVVADYARSVEDGVKAGNYNWSNSAITSSNFPSTRKGTSEVNIHLIHFNKNMNTDQVLSELDKQGLRSAELLELLAFGVAYPEKQREFPIVALGSVWHRRVPCLVRGDSERYLDLRWIDSGWYEIYRFAAVRK